MMLDAKLFNVNGNSLPDPLIIGTFEKRAPGSKACLEKCLIGNMYLEQDERSPNGNLSVLLCVNVELTYYNRVMVIKKQ